MKKVLIGIVGYFTLVGAIHTFSCNKAYAGDSVWESAKRMAVALERIADELHEQNSLAKHQSED